MPTPADPKWRSRLWQTYHEPRADYIKRLYADITFFKYMMRVWEDLGRFKPYLSSDLVSCIKSERKQLEGAQNELRKVLGR